jgi:hypothetical protein
MCDAFHAKLWGVYLGLRIPQLIVESDSKILINMITDNCGFNGTDNCGFNGTDNCGFEFPMLLVNFMLSSLVS